MILLPIHEMQLVFYISLVTISNGRQLVKCAKINLHKFSVIKCEQYDNQELVFNLQCTRQADLQRETQTSLQ